MSQPLYCLSEAWSARCQALSLNVSDVEALAAQGSVVEAHRHLLRLIAGTGIGASQTTHLWTAPFVCGPRPLPSGQGAGLCQERPGAAADAPTRSAPNDVPTAGLAAAAGVAVQRGQLVSPAGKFRRFRPLVRPRLLMARSVSVPRISMQVFVWNAAAGGASNG